MNINQIDEKHNEILLKKEREQNKTLRNLLVDCKSYIVPSTHFVDKSLQNQAERLLKLINHEIHE